MKTPDRDPGSTPVAWFLGVHSPPFARRKRRCGGLDWGHGEDGDGSPSEQLLLAGVGVAPSRACAPPASRPAGSVEEDVFGVGSAGVLAWVVRHRREQDRAAAEELRAVA